MAADDDTSQAFSLLHPGLQRWLWKKGWKELRPIQERAFKPILDGKCDVILAAPTAGGKTEAAFLPIVSRLASSEVPGLCVCISPLKALINDQHDRLEELCSASKIGVTRWHGDVSQSHKKTFLDSPSGVLLLTPESLEAQLVRRGPQARSFFGQLVYVVVDELHAFVGTERGKQLQSLLYRLELIKRETVPRVALSATLGDVRAAAEFLRPGRGAEAECIEDTGAGRELKILQKGYRRLALVPGADEEKEQELGDLVDVGRHLFKVLRGSHNLVFANSRANVESVADILRRLCEEENVPNEFLPHHGSLSKDFREHAEQMLKQKSKPATLVATTTLEMGIDVGSVRSIAQVGNPPSVASMRQRMGRSGREEGEPAILRTYITEEEGADLSPQDALRAQTVQAIAMVQLMLDGWNEPPDVRPLHLSTLIQQLLAIVAQHGGVRAAEAWSVLCEHGPFRLGDKARFITLLRELGKHELLTQTGDSLLVLGLRGERLVDHYEFYAAFFSPDEFELLHDGKALGTIPITWPLTPDSHLIFTGRRWQVIEVDTESKKISVRPSPGGRPPKFDGAGAPVHGHVRRQMKEVYQSKGVPRFADATSQELLAEGRERFKALGLHKRSFVEQGKSTWFFPWCGDRVLSTLGLLLESAGVDVVNEGIALQANCSQQALQQRLRDILVRGLAPAEKLAERVSNKLVGKYDHYLPVELQNLNFACAILDVEGAKGVLERLQQSGELSVPATVGPKPGKVELRLVREPEELAPPQEGGTALSPSMFPRLLEWARQRGQPITVFDLETTTNIPTAKWMGITELGMLTLYPDGRLQEVTALVNPERNIPPKVRALTGISNEEVRSQPTWNSWAERLDTYAQTHVMVGYNSSSFDCPTIIHQNARYGVRGTLFEFSLDVMNLPGVRGTLAEVAAQLGIASSRYHRAMADVVVTARLAEAKLELGGRLVFDAAVMTVRGRT